MKRKDIKDFSEKENVDFQWLQEPINQVAVDLNQAVTRYSNSVFERMERLVDEGMDPDNAYKLKKIYGKELIAMCDRIMQNIKENTKPTL